MLLEEQTLTIDHFKQMMDYSSSDIAESYVIALHLHNEFKDLKYPFALMINHNDTKSSGLMVDSIDLKAGTVTLSTISIRHLEEQQLWANKRISYISGRLFPTLFSEFR